MAGDPRLLHQGDPGDRGRSACSSRSSPASRRRRTDSGLVDDHRLVGVAVTILVGFVKRVATSYTITNRRLHIKRGIVSRTIQETRLERVQNVNYHQTVVQRMLQIGDVDFDTAAGDDYNFIFAGVAEPEEVVHMVDQATRRRARRRRASATSRTAPAATLRRVGRLGGRGAGSPTPAASRSASARSVRSQVKSWSSRPKWP